MSVSETYATNIDAAIAAYSDMVYKIALARTGNRNDAGDVFQEVFLRLVKHKNKITSDEHLKRWLIRVAINCCKTSFLKWKNARFVETDVSEHGTWLLPEESDVYLAVHRLPPKYRDVIHLFYYEDLSVKEISEIL
jgi:RNA polymerase sigma-70 factor (ECF subfamily)